MIRGVPPSWRRFAVALVGLAAVVSYLWGVPDTLERVRRAPNGRDFASYYFAASAAELGRDPYDVRALRRTAAEAGRPGVHPFFYPPPFLLVVAWAPSLPLSDAFTSWALLDVTCALLACLVLAVSWRSLHPLVPAMVALLLAVTTAIPNNHAMGQANHLVLLLVLAGLFAEARGRWAVGGVLVGLACMAKMSPALFVAWWLFQRRWRPALAAVGCAVAVSVLSLALVPWSVQVRFYTEVLPQFASGTYNGLAVPIGLFGNHSIPNLLDQLFPSRGPGLSPAAAWAGRGAALALLTGLAIRFRREPDPLARAGQIGAIAAVMLLLPVYTYEHHLVWTLPGLVAGASGVLRRRLHWAWVFLLVGAAIVVAWDLQDLKRSAHRSPDLAFAYREAKTVAVLAIALVCGWLGGTRDRL